MYGKRRTAARPDDVLPPARSPKVDESAPAEAIPKSTDGLDGRGVTAESVANATDVHIDDVRFARCGRADPLGELSSGHDLTRPLDEGCEDVELAQGERDTTPLDENLVAAEIEEENSFPKVPGVPRRAA
jgi:hypothetical protein